MGFYSIFLRRKQDYKKGNLFDFSPIPISMRTILKPYKNNLAELQNRFQALLLQSSTHFLIGTIKIVSFRIMILMELYLCRLLSRKIYSYLFLLCQNSTSKSSSKKGKPELVKSPSMESPSKRRFLCQWEQKPRSKV